MSDTCTWTQDDCHADAWDCSACGAKWVFDEGGPADNSMRFCPECGRKITEIVRAEKEDYDE